MSSVKAGTETPPRAPSSSSGAATSPGRRVLATGRYLELVDDHGWEYVRRVVASGVVIIVAATDQDEVVLVEQHRAAVGKRTMELPAGLVGDDAGGEGEPMEQAAARELEEETGFRARQWECLAEGPPSPGMSCELVTFFRARGLERVGPGGGDASEQITVHLVPRATVHEFLARQPRDTVLVDPKVYVGLYFLQAEAHGDDGAA